MTSQSYDSLKLMVTRIARMVPVEVLQDDMVGFASDLPFAQQSMKGKQIFSEKVLWGEIWIADCSDRAMWWAGYVRNGDLYLEQSARNKFLYNRKHERQVPTLMPVGTYKVWLDAWTRLSDKVYVGDAPFTTDAIDTDGGPWSAPSLPDRKYWQQLRIERPKKKGDPHRIRIHSQRFHWLYRLSRIVDLLDQLLLSHEKLIEKVSEAGFSASYISQFLNVLEQSGTNLGHIFTPDGMEPNYAGMQSTVVSVRNRCDNFINYGCCESGQSTMPERQHINNIAQLLWRLIHNQRFGRDVKFYDSVLAEEHRLLLARIAAILNRIPRAAISTAPHDRYSVWLTSASFAYGKAFAEQFTFPYYNAKGYGITFSPSKPAATVEWVNSVRRYGISMLNAGAVFAPYLKLDVKGIDTLLQAEMKLWGATAEIDEIFKLCNDYIDKFGKAGDYYWSSKIWNNRDLLLEDFTRVADGKPIRPEIAELQRIRTEIEAIRSKLDKALAARQTKLTDRLKTKTPAIVAGIQALEIGIKWWVAGAAYQKFRKAVEMHDPRAIVKLVEFSGKALDAVGTTIRWLGVHKVVAWKFGEEAAEKLGKLGKGLSAVADIVSFATYSYDMFIREDDYGKQLMETYLPEDAVGMYGFHLLTWVGKGLVATGSSGETLSKSPGFVKLQSIGYAIQFAGELGEAIWQYGALEHKHTHSVNDLLTQQAIAASSMLKKRGLEADLYPADDRIQMGDYMREFKWLRVDPDLYAITLGGPPDP